MNPKKNPTQKLRDQRRNFLKKSSSTLASFYIVPSHVVSGLGHTPPSDKLNIAGVGVGGKGRPNLNAMKSENIVALCDVDWNTAEGCFSDFPNARKYKDWRRMLDEMGKDIDAVMVATADHTHAAIAAHAMTLGKHLYCQKPLTHSIYESRLLTKLAERYPVATQMGNQGNSGIDAKEVCEWIWNGEIGEIREVHAWTNRPIWPQGLERPTETRPIPATMDWDLFLGPAPYRPFHEIYTPWNWRGWWDFGTGAFGDMACHVLDPVYLSLHLGYPTHIEGSSSPINMESAPQAEQVKFRFPERKDPMGRLLPEVDVYWYDGGLLPYRPDLLPSGVDLMADGLGGCIFVGSKDTLYCGCGGVGKRLLSGRIPNVTPSLRRIPDAKGYKDGPHEQDWIRACKESPANRTKASSHFGVSGPFNEMVLLGVLAVRLQGLHKTLEWDGDNMQFRNIHSSDKLRVIQSDRFSIKNGKPSFDKQVAELNAEAAAKEYIRHTYREGWTLPPMP
ncbi:Myo-inositol 2-dehydrogenase [Lunatimonas lonarensis]|uniref:Myo-inositol 2-dehydrogenase n=1 Tax=Lunatimonas lonarensis TaxID=1232681 RepID=R7ZTV2_9BACT|nr:Gfo/Idh/MocA family oxidoreductase [Lunatimonas lonarensis]EON77429.1 Myo-inositol 2-dehydrogenase [Lunatimonas lonarensis]